MRVVFHLGAPKTGTSLIQLYLRRAAARRVRRGTAVVPRHHTNELIGWGDTVVREPRRLRRRIEAEARRGARTLVISHEAGLGRPIESGRFFPHAPELADALQKISRDFEPTVVFYVRPIPSFLESYYLQTIHEGDSHTFEAWLSGVDHGELSWRPLVAALDESFGPASVLLGDFGEIEPDQNRFLRGFLHRAGVPPWTVVRYRYRANPSISQAGLQVALTHHRPLRTPADRRVWRSELQSSFSNLDGARATPMPAALRDQLSAITCDEYDLLAARAEETLSELEGRR